MQVEVVLVGLCLTIVATCNFGGIVACRDRKLEGFWGFAAVTCKNHSKVARRGTKQNGFSGRGYANKPKDSSERSTLRFVSGLCGGRLRTRVCGRNCRIDCGRVSVRFASRGIAAGIMWMGSVDGVLWRGVAGRGCTSNVGQVENLLVGMGCR